MTVYSGLAIWTGWGFIISKAPAFYLSKICFTVLQFACKQICESAYLAYNLLLILLLMYVNL